MTLERVGSRQVLVHHGVGERKQTPFPARLEFTSDGLGVLMPTQDDRDVRPV